MTVAEFPVDERRPLLCARDVELNVGGHTLLKSLSLDVHPGDRWCVLGPNGSGKTTLLRVLAGICRPNRGAVHLRGMPYDRWAPRLAALERSFLPQGESYAFQASVRDCVLLGRHPHSSRFGWLSARDRECACAAMSVMDLTLLAERDVRTLSGGEQQRTRLAAMLAQDPKLFVLDEPTSHLDLGHQAALFRHLANLCEHERSALIFSTHELSLAARFATHALVFCGDGSVRCGASADVLRHDFLSDAFGFPIDAAQGASGNAFVPRW